MLCLIVLGVMLRPQAVGRDRPRDYEQVVAQPLDPVDRESSCIADCADADVGEGKALAAEQHRCEVDEILVDEARRDERAREGRTTLDEGVTDAAREQLGENCRQIPGARDDRGLRVTQNQSAAGDRALTDHDRNRLVRHQLSGVTASGEARVVGQYRAGAHDDRVGLLALLVNALAGGGAGDPLAGAIRRGRATVEARCPLQGDEWATQALGGKPDAHGFGCLVREHPALDDHSGLSQSLRASARVFARVGYGVDDTLDPGRDECFGAGTREPLVVTRLECDDGDETCGFGHPGQGIHLRMGRACSAVPALGDDAAVSIHEHTADLRIDAGRRTARREREGVAHERLERSACLCGGHPVVSNLHMKTDSGPVSTLADIVRARPEAITRASSHPD